MSSNGAIGGFLVVDGCIFCDMEWKDDELMVRDLWYGQFMLLDLGRRIVGLDGYGAVRGHLGSAVILEEDVLFGEKGAGCELRNEELFPIGGCAREV
mmetsp:Transcript_8022/g.14695  ORF Transcript_8022/g.14695 Transcript_8022/m.14695 type:complete len:97 (+) Transcript_8022:19-309(+)